MNRLPLEKRCRIVSALVEGNSLRSTSRMIGVSINTVTKLLIEVGAACSEYQDRVMRNLTCRRLQIDEIWAFCYSKQKNVPEAHRGEFGYGDVWTFVAIDADTKLIPHWLHGDRNICDARSFVDDLAARLAHRVQITTDGHRMYLEAMESGFGGEVDYAQLIKLYGNEGSRQSPEARYSPGECRGTTVNVVSGRPKQGALPCQQSARADLQNSALPLRGSDFPPRPHVLPLSPFGFAAGAGRLETVDSCKGGGGMPAEDTKDAGLIRRAIRERWPIPEEKRSALIARAIQIAEHSDKEKAVIGAVRAVLEADKINLEQEKRDLQIPERTINEHYIRFIEVGGGDKVPEISGTAEGGLSNGPSRS